MASESLYLMLFNNKGDTTNDNNVPKHIMIVERMLSERCFSTSASFM